MGLLQKLNSGVYDTPELSFKENQNIKLIPLDLSNYQNIPKLPSILEGTLCVMPTNHYEGFFVCKLKKIK